MTLYSRQEIANILQGLGSAEQAVEKSQIYPLTEYETGRRAGFKAALVACGLSLGLGPMLSHWRADGPAWHEMDRGAGQ